MSMTIVSPSLQSTVETVVPSSTNVTRNFMRSWYEAVSVSFPSSRMVSPTRTGVPSSLSQWSNTRPSVSSHSRVTV